MPWRTPRGSTQSSDTKHPGAGHEHGFAAVEEPHAGDLPNIVVNADGTAAAHFLNWRLHVEDLMDADGSALSGSM